MSSFIKVLCIAVALIWAAAMVTGCAPNRGTIQPSKLVEAQGWENSHLILQRVDVYETGEELVVQGNLHKDNRNSPDILNAHIDIDYHLTDGAVVKKVKVPYNPQIISRRGPRQAYFNSHAALDPYMVSSITIKYHIGEHNGS